MAAGEKMKTEGVGGKRKKKEKGGKEKGEKRLKNDLNTDKNAPPPLHPPPAAEKMMCQR